MSAPTNLAQQLSILPNGISRKGNRWAKPIRLNEAYPALDTSITTHAIFILKKVVSKLYRLFPHAPHMKPKTTGD
jgi:hypothetical protein